MAKKENVYAKWTDDELVEHSRSLENRTTEMRDEINSYKNSIKIRQSSLEENESIQLKLEAEMKKRGIYDFESRMKKKYGTGLTDKQWNKVFRKAWEDGHSSGENEVENELIELAELFED